MSKQIAEEVHERVYPLFSYVKDIDNPDIQMTEDWRSYAEQVRRGESFSDDCDAFACTSQELAVEAGARAAIAFCRVEESAGRGGHLVCLVWDEDGEGAWVIDNRHKWVMPWNELDYEWVSANDGSGWKEIT